MIPQLFTSAFDQSNPKEIADELRYKKGYYIIEEAVRPDVLLDIVNKIKSTDCLINNNDLGVVRASWANYLSHTLAVSKQCYDIITSKKVRSICQNYFDESFKVSNQRLYETHTRAHLPWHTDNNLHSGYSFKGKHNLPGIVFLFYLSDVSDTNPFQLLPNSYKWSHENAERFFSDNFIQQNYADEVVSVRAPKGTLIMCNSHLIHRAEPFNRVGFKRYTFVFQVDEVSEAHAGHGETLLINPSFVDDRNPDILSYLGFGTKSEYPALPQTSVATMLPQDILSLQKNILPKALRGLMMSMAKGLLPGSILTSIKNRMYQQLDTSSKRIKSFTE